MTQTIVDRIDMEQKRKFDEFVSTLNEEPPVETEFKLGQRVVFVNEYGVICPDVRIIGYADDDSFYGRFIYLNYDCYWFPAKPESLRTYADDDSFIVNEGEIIADKSETPDWRKYETPQTS